MLTVMIDEKSVSRKLNASANYSSNVSLQIQGGGGGQAIHDSWWKKPAGSAARKQTIAVLG